MLTSNVKWSQMVRNPIRPDENAKHKKFEACDAGEISSSSAATAAATALPVATQKKSKNEIRDQMQNMANFFYQMPWSYQKSRMCPHMFE